MAQREQDSLCDAGVAYTEFTMNTLPNDYARCNGVGFNEDGEMHWREGCEHCLRRTAPRSDYYSMIAPPPIIAFECEYLIEPDDKIKNKPRI